MVCRLRKLELRGGGDSAEPDVEDALERPDAGASACTCVSEWRICALFLLLLLWRFFLSWYDARRLLGPLAPARTCTWCWNVALRLLRPDAALLLLLAVALLSAGAARARVLVDRGHRGGGRLRGGAEWSGAQ